MSCQVRNFKTLVFDVVKKDVCNALLNLIDKERDGAVVDRSVGECVDVCGGMKDIGCISSQILSSPIWWYCLTWQHTLFYSTILYYVIFFTEGWSDRVWSYLRTWVWGLCPCTPLISKRTSSHPPGNVIYCTVMWCGVCLSICHVSYFTLPSLLPFLLKSSHLLSSLSVIFPLIVACNTVTHPPLYLYLYFYFYPPDTPFRDFYLYFYLSSTNLYNTHLSSPTLCPL